MTPRRVIVNADDLGWSQGVTDGILHAHRHGILTSATLAANLPDALSAANLAAAEPALGVGLHLSVVQGQPMRYAGAERVAGEAPIRQINDELLEHT